ncbi:transmembrane protein 59 [Synchiropus picturatus]
MGTRPGALLLLGLLLFPALVSTSEDVFNSVLGSTLSCQKSCEMTYSLHTYPREEELYACQRGCRLFSICQFVRDSADLNQTKSECESTCREAYKNANEQYACILGCQSQLPFAEQRQEQLEAMVPKIHLLYPLALVRGMWEDVMSTAQSFITSSWTFYLQADDGKVVIFQTEPEVQFFTELDIERQNQDSRKSFFSSPFFKDYERTLIQERELSDDQSYREYNFFSCLSRTHWLPGWILTMTLTLSCFVLIWICCATVATAVDQYMPTEKLSINGDGEYMAEKKLKPYPASSLLIVASVPGQEEAGPLPPKVNLGQSDI